MGTAQASDYLENKLIDHIFRAASFAKPAAIYLALFTGAPSDASGGTEVTGGGYARVAVAPNDANWKSTQGTTTGASSGTGGATKNAVVITFPVPSSAWGVCTHFGVFDAATGGNLLIWDVLGSPRNVQAGDAPSFAVDGLTISVA